MCLVPIFDIKYVYHYKTNPEVRKCGYIMLIYIYYIVYTFLSKYKTLYAFHTYILYI